jgi:ribonuclease P protein component
MGDVTSAQSKFSLTRQNRLINSHDFARVFSGGQRSADKYLTLLFVPNDKSVARIGFAVAKKRLPRAVDRNRVRRLARESFRKNRDSLGCLDIVIMARSQASCAPNPRLFESLEKHWAKLVAAQQADDENVTNEKH